MALEEQFAVREHSAVLPACRFVEALGPSVWIGAEPEPLQPARPEPAHHLVVQAPAMPLSRVLRLHEQRPDIARLDIGNGEANPSFARALDGDDDVFVGDDGRC